MAPDADDLATYPKGTLMLRGASPRLLAAATAATVICTGVVVAVSSTTAQAAPARAAAAAAAAGVAHPAHLAHLAYPVQGKLSTTVAPGGNFNLSVWELQEPVGSPGSPRTIPSSQLQGTKGYQDTYFYTDPHDGAMTFWAPEKGVTTPNSNYARSELREMNTDGSNADWHLAGSHQLQATLRVVSVTNHVCVGQIHLGTGGSSTKPLVELYYYANGNIVLGTENSPDGGQATHQIANVPVGTQWSYTIAVTGGNTVVLTVNGKTTRYAIPSSFDKYHMYFKAGSYNQSSSNSTTRGARVAFYALTVRHG